MWNYYCNSCKGDFLYHEMTAQETCPYCGSEDFG